MTLSNNRPNILIVCGRNKKRSRTAESIFKNDDRFSIRSVGVSKKSDRKISGNDILWSDIILVMEAKYRGRIWDEFSQLKIPKTLILDIPDDYEYMDTDLIDILSDKIEDTLKQEYKI